MIFGFSLGNRIGDMKGFAYAVYILPGLAQMSLIRGAFTNSAFSLYQAKMERSIENLLTAPLHHFEIALGYVFGALVRGLTTAICTILVAACFVRFPFEHVGILLVVWLLSGFLFASIGIIVGVYSKSWDQMSNVETFLLTPLIYLGGSFYSIDLLPPFWKTLSHVNPIFYSVDLTRYGFLGISDIDVTTALVTLTVLTIVAFVLAVQSFRKSIDWIVR